jgi:hypothetical protein
MYENGPLYAKTIDEKRTALLLAVGSLAPDLPIGDKSIGYYDPATGRWSPPVGAANSIGAKPYGSGR